MNQSETSQGIASARYTATHTIVIEEVRPCFSYLEWPRDRGNRCFPFGVPDPDAGEDQLQLECVLSFGGLGPGHVPELRCELRTKDSYVFVQDIKFAALDDNMNVLAADSLDFDDFLMEEFLEVVTLRFVSESGDPISVPPTLRVICQITYFGRPTTAVPADVQDPVPTIPTCDLNLHDDLLRLLLDEESADVVIVVGEKRFKAHKCLLKARSDYFKHLFDSGLNESRTNELKIEEADPEMFHALLKFVYSGLAPSNLRDIAHTLLPLADRFGLVPLKNMCTAALDVGLCPENAIETLLVADAHNEPALAKKCFSLIRLNLTLLKETEDWQDLKKYPDLCMSLFLGD